MTRKYRLGEWIKMPFDSQIPAIRKWCLRTVEHLMKINKPVKVMFS